MVECTALMVALNDMTGREVYISVDIEYDEDSPPQNNSTDILRCVNLANKDNKEGWTYFDMFGIIVDGERELWEDEKDLVRRQKQYRKENENELQKIKATNNM